MKKTTFYPNKWQLIPYSFDVMDQRDAEGKPIKDLVLKNNYALERGISEMTLNITGLSAFDKKGREHFITEFDTQVLLTLKGMHTGLFIKSKNVLDLKPGEYLAFRFYMNPLGNRFRYSDGESEPVYWFEHLDFEIENGLSIKGKEAGQVVMRFDFAPYALSGYFKTWFKLFRRSGPASAKMARSYGN